MVPDASAVALQIDGAFETVQPVLSVALRRHFADAEAVEGVRVIRPQHLMSSSQRLLVEDQRLLEIARHPQIHCRIHDNDRRASKYRADARAFGSRAVVPMTLLQFVSAGQRAM